jgi:putative transcriptional regulator
MADKEKINRLKIVLVEMEMSQKEFAERLSVSANTIYRFCKNESQPSLRLLKKMSVILNIDIRELLISTQPKGK